MKRRLFGLMCQGGRLCIVCVRLLDVCVSLPAVCGHLWSFTGSLWLFAGGLWSCAGACDRLGSFVVVCSHCLF